MHSVNYIQIVEMTKEEKVKMYMKHTKRELIEMLINCNNILDQLCKPTLQPCQPHQCCGVDCTPPPFCGCNFESWRDSCPRDMVVNDWQNTCPGDMVFDMNGRPTSGFCESGYCTSASTISSSACINENEDVCVSEEN